MLGGGGPGRSIYIARRIIAGLVVLLVLALVGYWAWHTFLSPAQEPRSEAPESDRVNSSGTSAEETTTEEGSTTSLKEPVASNKESKESFQERVQGSTESTIENPEVVALTPATVSPVPAASVESPVSTSPSKEVLPAPTSNAPLLPPPTPPLPSPSAGSTNEASNLATQVASNSTQVPASPPSSNQLKMVQPLALEEAAPFMGTANLEEEAPLEETTLTGQALVESPTLEESTSANVSATAGDTVAVAGKGASAISGTVAAIAG